jgi:hypothetical protein
MRRSHRHSNEESDRSPIPGRPVRSNLNAGSWVHRGPAASRAGRPAGLSVGDQLVVIYGRGRATAVYAAAYTAHQAEAALRRCIAHHGGRVSARVVPARSSLPEAL